jgi:hypothetical protein
VPRVQLAVIIHDGGQQHPLSVCPCATTTAAGLGKRIVCSNKKRFLGIFYSRAAILSSTKDPHAQPLLFDMKIKLNWG